jgi:hypothetical protein
MRLIIHIFGQLKRGILIIWDKYMAAYGKASKDGYKKNAFSPLAWFSIFLIIPLIVAILWVGTGIIQYLLIGLLCVIVIFTLTMYLILLTKDPNLLQSEWYRLEEHKLNMIGEKGGEIKIAKVDLNSNARIGGEDD